MKKIDPKYFLIFALVVVITYLVIFDNNTELNNNMSTGAEDYLVTIKKPETNIITGRGNYSLNCSTKKYTNITIEGSIIPESSIKISDGNEEQVLYVEELKAKYFGAEYDVIQDDSSYLIIMRSYPVSGLTEVISINKELGIGFDTNTKSLGLSGAPTSDTYLTSCYQI